jgi:hypothetical protein
LVPQRGWEIRCHIVKLGMCIPALKQEDEFFAK